MKKRNTLVLALLPLLLAACGSPTSSSQPDNPSVDNSSSEPSTGDSTSQVTPEIDEELSLTMFGDLYYNGYRTIYATLKNDTDSEIIWESSDPSVATVSGRTGLSSEGNVIAQGYGTTTITAYLEDYPSIRQTKEITISHGEVMPFALYNKITSSVKVLSNQYFYSYDKEYKKTLDAEYYIETIYEESGTYKGDEINTTDNYEITVKDVRRNVITDHLAYVRGDRGGNVSTEYKDMYNRIMHEPVINENSEEPTKWLASIYPNRLGDSKIIDNTLFESFDGGKTYHFIGTDYVSSTIFASILMGGASVDDMYFAIDGENIALHFDIDPYNEDKNVSVKYGMEVVCNFTEMGTAKITHIPLFEHQPYHDTLKAAIDKLKTQHNYTVKTTFDYPHTENDYAVEYRFDDNNVNKRIYDVNGKLTAHNGFHKTTGDAFYSYEVDLATGNITIVKEFEKGWDIYGRYPVFSFAPEIFETKDNTHFSTIELMGQFITKALPLTPDFDLYQYPETGYIDLDEENNISKIYTKVLALDDAVNVSGTYTNVGKTVIDLNFDGAETEADPTTWQEENPNLYKEMCDWQIQDVVPFLHAKVGYEDFISKGSQSGVNKKVFFNTKPFNTRDEQDQFIAQYQQVLLDNGFVDTGDVDSDKGFKLYKKDAFMIGVGYEKIWNMVKYGCQILVMSPTLSYHGN